jgi:hypothetical protein
MPSKQHVITTSEKIDPPKISARRFEMMNGVASTYSDQIARLQHPKTVVSLLSLMKQNFAIASQKKKSSLLKAWAVPI